MRKVELLPTRDCEAGYGPARNEGIEKDLAMRQLSIKKRNSNSWFVRVDQTLSKYGLRSAVDIITNPPQAEAWKTEIDDAIWGFWHKKRLEICLH